MTYCSSLSVWNTLGKNAYSKVRSEIVGTGTAATASYSLAHDNLVTNSLTLYSGSTAITSSFTQNLDDGIVTLSVPTGSILTADYKYTDIPDSQIQAMISSSDLLIETETGRTFNQTTGSVEYLSRDEEQSEFFLRNYPVITLSSVEVNLNENAATENWETKVAGLGGEYLANDRDLEVGRFRFIDNFPNIQEDVIKVTYDYGYSSVPADIQELSTLLTIRQIAQSSVYKSIVTGQDNFTPVRLNEIENRIQELIRLRKKSNYSSI